MIRNLGFFKMPIVVPSCIHSIHHKYTINLLICKEKNDLADL